MEKLSGVLGVTGTPWVIIYMNPRPMLSVPSVAMNGGKPITVINNPFARPNINPTQIPAATHMDWE
ncbi:hypothetical protein GALL_539620 [mine drainage metagenome]|uniref:Uncharacterized protein n=1 Tax=mine drainage metagenome TaxID=410659 RepID=A0A1J5P9J8_9ZZZZ